MANNKLDFTDTGIAALPSPEPGKRAYFYDLSTKGLGVGITPSGTKTFILYRWLKGKPERVTLGRFPDISVTEARQLAGDANTKIARGINPNIEKKRIRAGKEVLLGTVLGDFLSARTKLSPRTVYDYRRIVNIYLQDWQDLPIASITERMVDERFQAISNGMKVKVKNRKGGTEEIEVRSPAQANYSMRVFRVLVHFAMQHYRDKDGHPLVVDSPIRQSFQMPINERDEQRVLNDDELKAWFDAVSHLKSDAANAKPEVIRTFLLFLLLTGMRNQDAAKLRKTQIDFKTRILTMFDVAHKQPRMLPLSDYLYVMLRKLCESTEGPFVFPGNGPKGYLVDSRKQLLKIMESSGVKFTLHDLRRTFVAIAETLDIPAYALAKLVNNKSDKGAAVDVEKLRGPMQMVTDRILKSADAKKSVDAIAMLSDQGADRLKEKITHILAVRNGVA